MADYIFLDLAIRQKQGVFAGAISPRNQAKQEKRQEQGAGPPSFF